MSDSVDQHRLAKTLTWRDGMALALALPTGLFVTFGYLLGVVGAWVAITVWFVGAVVSYLQCRVFAEMASMFPRDSGGVARYALFGRARHRACSRSRHSPTTTTDPVYEKGPTRDKHGAGSYQCGLCQRSANFI
ncbi:hypothetical protein [Rhodococcus koreensis]